MTPATAVGFYGKLGSAGDFVQRRLPAAFVQAWDRAFEPAVAGARAHWPQAWSEIWRQTPVWRFVLAPGVVGNTTWMGCWGPGVDRVGRCFPLMIGVELPPAALPGVLGRMPWFEAAEAVLIEALARGPSVDALDAQVAALSSVMTRSPDDPRALLDHLGADGETGLRLPLPGVGAFDAGYLSALWLRAGGDGRSLWWTRGGVCVPASIQICRGFPAPPAFVAFVDGSQASSWRSVGKFSIPAAAPVAAFTPEVSMATPADDLDDLLIAGPSAARASPAQVADDTEQTRPVLHARSVAEAMEQTPVVHRSDCGLTVVAADNSGADLRGRAAERVLSAARGLDASAIAGTLMPLVERLQILHRQLREAADDLVDPLRCDCGVAAALPVQGGFVTLAAGAAAVWRSRAGRVESIARPLGSAALPGGDGLDALLYAPTASAAPGLGSTAEPQFQGARCSSLGGDRLLLAANAAVAGLEPRLLARALGAETASEASRRIAAAVGLQTPPDTWPFVVIEIES